MRQKIYFDLFSTITYNNESISADTTKKISPLSCIIKKNGYKGKFFLVGDASMGKSSNITTVKIHLLKERKEFYYFNLADLNHEVKTAPEIIPNIVILDSYDEVWKENKNKAYEFIKNILSKNIVCLIIASRYMPTATDGFSKEVLEDFIRLNLNELREYQINRYAEKHCGSIKVNSFIKKLFVCPMCLKMFIEMNDKLRVGDIEDEASFISEYFRQMSENKKFAKTSEEGFNSYRLHKAAFDTVKKGGYQQELLVQNVYNTIFYQKHVLNPGSYFLTSSSVRYINWAAAKYIVNEIKLEYEKFNAFSVRYLEHLLDFDFEEDNKEVLRFVGELLRHVPDKEAIIKALDDKDLKKQDTKWFYNLAIIVIVCYGYKIDDNIFGIGDFFLKNFIKQISEEVLFAAEDIFICEIESKFSNYAKFNYNNFPYQDELTEFKKSSNGKIFELIKEIVYNQDCKFLKRNIYKETIYYGNCCVSWNDIAYITKDCTSIIMDVDAAFAKSFVVEEGNNYYSSKDGVLFNKNGSILIRYPGGKKNEKYNIPEGTKIVEKKAFELDRLVELVFPSSLEKNYNNFLSGVSNIIFSKGCKLKEICTCMFAFSKIKKLEIPHDVENIGNKAFLGCKNLGEIIIPKSVVNIGEGAFYACECLKELNIPSRHVVLGEDVFYDCNLEKLHLSKERNISPDELYNRCGLNRNCNVLYDLE